MNADAFVTEARTEADAFALKALGGRNPFTDEHCHEEIAAYGVTEDIDPGDGIKLTMIEPRMRCDDYLNVQFRLGGLHCPAFTIDGQIWMGLTPMETQSAHLAIQWATGRAATVGLGMGYFALRAAAKDDVESLDVYERDPRVIALFRKLFSDRPGFDKVNIIEGDARETLVGKEYDSIFVDPYPTLCADDALDDIALFLGANDIAQGGYTWWGRELVLLNALYHEVIDPVEIDWPTRCFLHTWEVTNNLRHNRLDEAYCEAVIEALYDHGQME